MNEKFRVVDTIQPSLTVAGPTRTQIPRTEAIRSLSLRISGTATEADVAAGTLTAEALLSLLRNVRIEATSGKRRNVGVIKNGDAAAMYRLWSMLYGQTLDYLEITPITKAAAASPFRFTLPIPFEMPFSEDSRQSLLNGTELESLDLLIDWGLTTDILSTGTWAFNTLTCQVSINEFVDAQTKLGRYSINKMSYQEEPTTATNSRLAFKLNPGFMLRGILLKQFTRTAYPHTPVSTVINTAALELNREVKFSYDWNVLQAQNVKDYGLAAVTGYAFIDCMREGRYDTIVDTAQYENVEVVLNVNGVANSYVRAYPIEMIPANR